jgi:formylglycine-generating enzyme required for sulfatase activity
MVALSKCFAQIVGIVVLSVALVRCLEPAPQSLYGTRAGEVRSDNGLKMKLVWCPPGQFTMGSPKDEEFRSWDEDEVRVTLTRGFWLGKYELTEGEWQQVMGTTPWTGRHNAKEGEGYPATCVNWNDALQFCHKLTETERRTGRLPANWRYTLPTEAQWEYACRAGTTTRFSFGRSKWDLTDYAWFKENSWDFGDRFPHQVGGKLPNPWGLYDIHGNVAEWCRDGYRMDKNGYPVRKGGNDPELSPADGWAVYRGGNFMNWLQSLRSAKRAPASIIPDGHQMDPGVREGIENPDELMCRFTHLGFRVALEPVGK